MNRGGSVQSDFNYCHTLRVRYSEVDGQMIVYNSHYLTYFDIALTEYFRNLGVTFLVISDEEQYDYSLVNTNITFYSPAYFDDILEIYVRVSNIGNSSFTVNFEVRKQDTEKLVVTGETVYVGYNAKLGQKMFMPDYLRLRIKKFEGMS